MDDTLASKLRRKSTTR